MKNSKIIVILSFFLVSILSFANKPNKLVFVSARPLNAPSMKFFFLIQEEAFKRLGINFEYKEVPAKRASIEANKGIVDGDLARVATYNKKFENLVRIDEHLNVIKFSAFSTNSSIKINGWDGFEGTNHNVTYKLGVMIAESNLAKYVAKNKIQPSPSFEVGVKKLLTNRADVYVGNAFAFLQEIDKFEKQGLKTKEIYEVGIMQEIKLYPFIHKKYADLAPAIANELKKMKDEGLFEEFRVKTGLQEGSVNWK